MSLIETIQLYKLSIVLSCQPTRFHAVALGGDFDQNLAFISRLGYQGVELAIRDPQQIDYTMLYQLLDCYSLEVPAIGTGQAWGEEHLSFTDPDPAARQMAIQRFLAHIPYAAKLGAKIIIGLLRGKTQPGQDPARVEAWLVEALQQCAQAASEKGVRLCIEPINRYETDLVNTVASGLDLIDRVGAENLGLLLDTFHMNIEEADMGAAIRQAGGRIFHFHVADSNRWHPGAGHLDFESILHGLREVGYRGYLSGEFMPLPGPDSAAEGAISFLRGILVRQESAHW